MQLLSKVVLTLTALTTLSSANPLPSKDRHGHGTKNESDKTSPSRHDEYDSPFKCVYPFKTFQQLVNHPQPGLSFASQTLLDEDGSNHPETFSQQYQVIDHYFKPGGPILFHQGGEMPSDCIELSPIHLYAMELGALVVSIEHRFFGNSVPKGLFFGNASTWTASDMRSLDLNNVLLDSVALVKHIKSTMPETHDSKVIAFGGSYSGTLVALLRLHFPDIFFGAFPSSGAFGGLISDPHDPLVHAWGDWVSQTIERASPNAAAKIRKAFQDLHDGIVSPPAGTGLEKLSTMTYGMKMFPISSGNSNDGVDEMRELNVRRMLHVYSNLVQYDRTASSSRQFSEMITNTLRQDGNDSVAVLEASVPTQKVLSQQASLKKARAEVMVELMMIPWGYIVCKYLPVPLQNYPSAGSIFGSLAPDYSSARVNDDVCGLQYGINSTEGGVAYQQKLGLDQPSLERSSRLFFTVGTSDPVTPLGPKVFWNSANEAGSGVLAITGGAHCEEMMAPTATDKTSVDNARLAQLNTMKEWLGMTDLPESYPYFASEENQERYCKVIKDVESMSKIEPCLGA